MPETLRLFVPLTKVDLAQRMVYGVAAAEEPDKSGEIFDFESSVPHFKEWSAQIAKATDGKSVGNVRAMHGKVSAGILKSIDFDPVGKAIPVAAHINDDAEWGKVQAGNYTGFSIGGEYVRKWADGDFKRYEARPSEISLVDNPCIPSATFTMVKADGQTEEVAFVREPRQVWECGEDGCTHEAKADAAKCDGSPAIAKREFSSKQRDKLAESGAAMKDGSYPIATKSDLKNAIQAFGRAKNKSAVKAHIKRRAKALGATDMLPEDWSKAAVPESLQKCLYGIAQLASTIARVDSCGCGCFCGCSCGCVCGCVCGCECMCSCGCNHTPSSMQEAAQEGDASTVPDKLKAGITALYDALVTMAQEEAAEWEEEEGAEMAMAVASTLEKINTKTERLRELLSKRAEQEDSDMKPEELQKIVDSSRDALAKTMSEGLEKLGAAITASETAAAKRFEKLEADVKLIKDNTPEKSPVVKRAVEKTEDTKDTDARPSSTGKKDVHELMKAALSPQNAIVR